MASLNERNLSTLAMETTQNVGNEGAMQVDENKDEVQVETIETESFEVVTSANSPRPNATNTELNIATEEVEDAEDEMYQIQNWLSNDTKTMGTMGDGENKSVEMGAI